MTNRLRVAILDDYQNCAMSLADWRAVQAFADMEVFTHPLRGTADEVAQQLRPFDVLCLMRERTAFPEALLERLPQLKLITMTGFFTTTLDIAAANARGIVVTHTASYSGPATVELAWGLILAATRHLAFEDAAMRRGEWQTTIGRTLRGLRLGLVGLGRLGQAMVPIGKAFGMEVVAWSSRLTAEQATAGGAQYVDKDVLFATADVISLHLLLSERSIGTVGAHELGLMKPTALLINTSRGPIVDEAALVEALRSKSIGGAGLDVYDVEPLPADHPLRTLPNTVLSPHLGFVTTDAHAAVYRETVENILAFHQGAPIRRLAPQQ